MNSWSFLEFFVLVEVPKCVGSDSQDVQICAPAQLKFFFLKKKEEEV